MVNGQLSPVERLTRLTLVPLAATVLAFSVGASTTRGTILFMMAFAAILTAITGHCPLRQLISSRAVGDNAHQRGGASVARPLLQVVVVAPEHRDPERRKLAA